MLCITVKVWFKPIISTHRFDFRRTCIALGWSTTPSSDSWEYFLAFCKWRNLIYVFGVRMILDMRSCCKAMVFQFWRNRAWSQGLDGERVTKGGGYRVIVRKELKMFSRHTRCTVVVGVCITLYEKHLEQWLNWSQGLVLREQNGINLGLVKEQHYTSYVNLNY